jgi:cysteine sulfinate desulfinase/cysteine desulfurase-like protein
MTACGISENLLDGILRISFCPENNLQEVTQAAELLNSIVANRKQIMS